MQIEFIAKVIDFAGFSKYKINANDKDNEKATADNVIPNSTGGDTIFLKINLCTGLSGSYEPINIRNSPVINIHSKNIKIIEFMAKCSENDANMNSLVFSL